jgi:hypothetical protein
VQEVAFVRRHNVRRLSDRRAVSAARVWCICSQSKHGAAEEVSRHEGLQRNVSNVSNGFDVVMRRLVAVYNVSKDDATATGCEELISHWPSACGLSDAVWQDLHLLRIWRNVSDHHDSERWAQDGLRSAASPGLHQCMAE